MEVIFFTKENPAISYTFNDVEKSENYVMLRDNGQDTWTKST